MRKPIACAVPLVLAGLLLAPPLGATQTDERSRTEGLKETDHFVAAGGNMSEAVAKAKQQVQKTLDAYNTIVTQPSVNMNSYYKKLMKSLDSMNDRLTEARRKIDEMQQAADSYFAGRASTVKNIQDPQLQDRARQRLTDSQKQFGEVLQS